MRQEPTYLLIGRGRLARHLAEYFRLLDVELPSWERSGRIKLPPLLGDATRILLAISDDAVEGFHRRWRDGVGGDARWIHFCGGRSFAGITRVHPLMTFNSNLYELSVYRRIPFVLDKGGPPFSSILPALDNPAYELSVEHTALYHAWAVLAGSATATTWREYRRVACEVFDLPESALHPYLEQVGKNSLDLDNPLTGPFARADDETIAANIEALASSPFQNLYRELANLTTSGEY